jgi:hypothetical protein
MNPNCRFHCQSFKELTTNDARTSCKNCTCVEWQHELIGATVSNVTTFFGSREHSVLPNTISNALIPFSSSVTPKASSFISTTPASFNNSLNSQCLFGSNVRDNENQLSNNVKLNKLETLSAFRGESVKDSSGLVNKRNSSLIPDTEELHARKRGGGGFGGGLQSKQGVVSKKSAEVKVPKMLLFFLRFGKRGPVIKSERLELKRTNQFYEDFIYFDGHKLISKVEFEEFFTLIDNEWLQPLFNRKLYRLQ